VCDAVYVLPCARFETGLDLHGVPSSVRVDTTRFPGFSGKFLGFAHGVGHPLLLLGGMQQHITVKKRGEYVQRRLQAPHV